MIHGGVLAYQVPLFADDDRHFPLVVEALAGRRIDDRRRARRQRGERLDEDQRLLRHGALAFLGVGGEVARDADDLGRRARDEQLDGGAIDDPIGRLAAGKRVTTQQSQPVVGGVGLVGLGLGGLRPMNGALELDAVEAVLR